jgi:3-deoxy-D-manno-octulosonate cytidylyltransferase
VVVIPARFASTRLPGKPLLLAAGRPLIAHVVDRARAASGVARVIVATDDLRIAGAAREAGAEARLTRTDHATGTDRIGELLPGLPEPIIVNVQGDEPDLDPALIPRLVARLLADPGLACATAAAPFPEGSDPSDRNRVKVLLDPEDRAIDFSRTPPSLGMAEGSGGVLLHLGIYAWRREALEKVLSLPRGERELRESLEQLRLLENGLRIGVVRVAAAHGGIDTAEDWAEFRARREGQHGPPGRSARWPSTSS